MKHAFYNSTLPSSVTSLILFQMANPTGTYDDIAGLNEASIDALVAALDDESQDEIFIFTPVAEAHAAGNFIDDQVAMAFLKLTEEGKGDMLVTGTAQAGGAKTITLAATASASNDAYNEMIIWLVDGTSKDQVARIEDYTGATKVADKFDPAWAGGNPGNDTVYEIYDAYAIREYYNVAVASFDGVYQSWNLMFSGIVPPKVIQYTMRDVTTGTPAGTCWAAAKGTATAGAATTITNSAAPFGTASAYVGMYVYIASGTGAGQYRKIISHTNAILTISTGATNWTVNPDNTSVYYVLPRTNELFYPQYFAYWVRTYGKNFTDPTIWKIWEDILDANGNLRAGRIEAGKAPMQIKETMDAMLIVGKHVYDYVIL